MSTETRGSRYSSLLSRLRREIETVNSRVESMEQQLSYSKNERDQKLTKYQKLRSSILKNETKKQGLSWCTNCFKIGAESEMKLAFIENGNVRDFRTRPTKELGGKIQPIEPRDVHRLCSECYLTALKYHNPQTIYDMGREEVWYRRRPRFLAYPAEGREPLGTYYYSINGKSGTDGVWYKVDVLVGHPEGLDEMLEEVREALAKVLELPPPILEK